MCHNFMVVSVLKSCFNATTSHSTNSYHCFSAINLIFSFFFFFLFIVGWNSGEASREAEEPAERNLTENRRGATTGLSFCSFMHTHTHTYLLLSSLAYCFPHFHPSCWLYFLLQHRLRLERDCDAELEGLPEEICCYLQGELESKGLRSDALFSQDSAGSGPPSNCSTPSFNSPNHNSSMDNSMASLDNSSSSSTITSESELTAI